ncbi:AGAP007052-PA-like protein [Anopheles sinensis]|uniref:AGAP007052-PA-like protein n=1 Tax=Anopheles sinensis TaxID=74873 RepID=A0A084WJU6_ANOSI|nr:AGAP007052-PA-like protein [Anopheles sinensis]
MDPVLLERERVLFRMNEEINAKSRGLFELNENVSWMTTKRRMRQGLKKLNNIGAGGPVELPAGDESCTSDLGGSIATTDKENEGQLHGTGTGSDEEEPESEPGRSASVIFALEVSRDGEGEKGPFGGQREAPATTTTLTEIRCDAIKEEHSRSNNVTSNQQMQLVKVTTVSVERKVSNGQRAAGNGGMVTPGMLLNGNSSSSSSKSVTSATARNLTKNMADVVPKVLEKKNISSDGLIKFLKSKVAILQTELETSQRQNEANVKDLHLALDRLKQLEALKEQLLTKNSALERTVKKFEERNLELDKLLKVNVVFQQSGSVKQTNGNKFDLLQEKDAQLNVAAKELFGARSEIRNLAQINQTQEKRLFKAQEEVESLRVKLNIANDSEKVPETRDAARQERLTYEKQIKQLRKQRTEVLADYKKLLLSVDQMKKQNFNQEQSKLLHDFEKDYFRHLDEAASSSPLP